MISYIINLFMIHYDLKRNNGYSETKKRRYFVCVCVCVCVFLSAQKNFPYSEMIFHISF